MSSCIQVTVPHSKKKHADDIDWPPAVAREKITVPPRFSILTATLATVAVCTHINFKLCGRDKGDRAQGRSLAFESSASRRCRLIRLRYTRSLPCSALKVCIRGFKPMYVHSF